MYACPCCGSLTISEPASYEVCSVCFWEDDGQSDTDADEVKGGPNQGLSLTQARENYARFAACEARFLPLVDGIKPD